MNRRHEDFQSTALPAELSRLAFFALNQSNKIGGHSQESFYPPNFPILSSSLDWLQSSELNRERASAAACIRTYADSVLAGFGNAGK